MTMLSFPNVRERYTRIIALLKEAGLALEFKTETLAKQPQHLLSFFVPLWVKDAGQIRALLVQELAGVSYVLHADPMTQRMQVRSLEPLKGQTKRDAPGC